MNNCIKLYNLLLGCGHCKSLAPVYEEVGETFKNEPNVCNYLLTKPESGFTVGT